MGLMDKFKNLFTEEVEEEVRPIKKEVRHVEIPSPKRSEVSKATEVNNISDSSAINKEEKVIAPVYFDDKDFDDLEKPKEKPKEKIKEKNVQKREENTKLYGGKIEEKKVEPVNFRPSPIISPVYGVLDKNYFKEEVTHKKNSNNAPIRRINDKMTVDDIRNKAYGTLEDDLKDNLLDDSYETYNEDTGAIDVLEELNFDEIDMDEDIKLTDHKVNTLLLNDLDLDDDTELLARQLEEQNRKLEEINQLIDEEDTSENRKIVFEKEEPEKEAATLEEIEEENVEESEEKEETVDLVETSDLIDEDSKEDELVEEPEIDVEKSIGELIDEQMEEPVIKEEKRAESKKRRSKKEDNEESLTDSELFDLVDSMYDEEGE